MTPHAARPLEYGFEALRRRRLAVESAYVEAHETWTIDQALGEFTLYLDASASFESTPDAVAHVTRQIVWLPRVLDSAYARSMPDLTDSLQGVREAAASLVLALTDVGDLHTPFSVVNRQLLRHELVALSTRH